METGFDAGIAFLAAKVGGGKAAKMAFATSAATRATGLQYDESYAEFRAAGLSKEEAEKRAIGDGLFRGAATVVSERIGIGHLMKIPVLNGTIKQVVTRIGMSALVEGTTEVAEDLAFDLYATSTRSADPRVR